MHLNFSLLVILLGCRTLELDQPNPPPQPLDTEQVIGSVMDNETTATNEGEQMPADEESAEEATDGAEGADGAEENTEAAQENTEANSDEVTTEEGGEEQ